MTDDIRAKMKRRRCSVARAAEVAAQRVYDLRDCVPATDQKLWLRLDKWAMWLGKYGTKRQKQFDKEKGLGHD